MSIYKRESFATFQERVISLNKVYGDDAVHADLMEARNNDEETVAAVSTNASDAVFARKKLLTIHKDFPYGAHPAEQAAFLLRAFAGLAPFAAGNLQTGYEYAAEMFERAGIAWNMDADLDELGLQITDRLGTYQGGFQRRNCLDRDDLFEWLVSWCKSTAL